MAEVKRKKIDALGCLFAPLNEMPIFKEMAEATRNPGCYAMYGLDDSQRLHVLAALQRVSRRMLLVLAPNDSAAQRMADDLSVFLAGQVMVFPAREISFHQVAASSRELSARRLEALGAAASGRLRALVCPVEALLHRLMPVKLFQNGLIALQEGQQIEPARLMEKLIQAGYSRVDRVESRGQCALRGGILDVYPVGQPSALRLEFFDDEIDSLRDFDVMTQRSVARRTKALLYPASEALLDQELADLAAGRLEKALADGLGSQFKRTDVVDELPPWEEDDEDELPDLQTMQRQSEQKGTMTSIFGAHAGQSLLQRNFERRIEQLKQLHAFDGMEALMPILYDHTDCVMDYLKDPLVIMDQPDRLRERCENLTLEFVEQFKHAAEQQEALPVQGGLLYEYDEILAQLKRETVLTVSPFLRAFDDVKPQALFKFEGMGAAGYQSNLRELARDIGKWRKDGWRIALMAGGVARGQRLERNLEELDCAAVFWEEPPYALDAGRPAILPYGINRGFLYPDIRLAVVSESDIYGVGKQKSRVRHTRGQKLEAFTDLNVGDYVVHENHGIGQYMGTVRLQSDGTYRDYLYIRYQGSDKLYVPTDQLDRVQKYIGADGATPKINKLSGNEWQKQKAKVKAGIQQIAGDLVKLYAERQAVRGHAFQPDTPWQRQFEDSFPYEETPDQLQAIEEIKRDMEKDSVMDRLLCGDVGYGKTEVALRAIFKCVMDGKQAALLAPTTILVQQHFTTIQKRFAGFPVRIEMLSRFRTPAEQKRILNALKMGEIDVIIGTHRLLAKDVVFKDLGLLVVDEEQRFGVQHKESIKQLKRSVDVLTLSATPIPRTLHMSMVGIRDMSILETPPEERYPVQTYVVEYSDSLVRDAILRELSREGQVYVLYNRVQSIERYYAHLKRLVPEARIAVGHGQMREHALEDVMLDFYEGQYDVLLCTTIIESGLDVPKANTLSVCDADRFGLAQLYQLRGRVGRSNRLAYAYLTVARNKVLTETAEKRLSAIRDFTEFGSGFRIAMRDMEIRGTGNLLGAEQSGHMSNVGYDMYVKLIEQTVNEFRGVADPADIETRVELRVDAYLPADYVSNDQLRIEVYKRIASIRDKESREDVLEELVDRFGDPTRPVLNLIDVAHLKGLANRLGIENVVFRQNQLVMTFSQYASLDINRLMEAIKPFSKHLNFTAKLPAHLSYREVNKSLEEMLRHVVPVMERVVDQTLAGDQGQADQ